MFNLVKIMNKSNNAPEIELFRSYYDVEVNAGDIGIVVNGVLISRALAEYSDSDIGALYFCHGKADYYDDTTFVPCTRITSDMIFEVACSKAHIPGTKLTFHQINDSELFSKVKECGDSDVGFMEVYSDKNYTATKKLQVRFFDISERNNV